MSGRERLTARGEDGKPVLRRSRAVAAPFARGVGVLGMLALPVLAGMSCVPPPRMCSRESDCGSQAVCVAGRCVAHGATPAIDTGRRLLFAPVDLGYVRRDDSSREMRLATLGCTRKPAIVFLRFSVPLAPEVLVLEAYVLLERATSVDADPVVIPLHVARVVTPWDGRSLSWATQPRFEEVGAPVTQVPPVPGAVRLDVRDIVQRWRKRERDDLGLAVLAEGESATGVAFALTPADEARDRDDPVLAPPAGPMQASSPFETRASTSAGSDGAGDPMRQQEGPRLELYVK
jgi:hypothetical protein